MTEPVGAVSEGTPRLRCFRMSSPFPGRGHWKAAFVTNAKALDPQASAEHRQFCSFTASTTLGFPPTWNMTHLGSQCLP